jgi:hypothetical protein
MSSRLLAAAIPLFFILCLCYFASAEEEAKQYDAIEYKVVNFDYFGQYRQILGNKQDITLEEYKVAFEALFNSLGEEGWVLDRNSGESALLMWRAVDPKTGKNRHKVEYALQNGRYIAAGAMQMFYELTRDRQLTAEERTKLYMECELQRRSEIGKEGWHIYQGEAPKFLQNVDCPVIVFRW